MDKFLIKVKRKRGKDESVEDECKAHSEPSGSESITSNRDREAENIENINCQKVFRVGKPLFHGYWQIVLEKQSVPFV